MDIAFDLILTSPYVRASRTAEIVAGVLGNDTLRSTINLAADADPKKLIEEIRPSEARLQNVLLVGHEPYLTQLISVLLSGKPDLQIDLKKAGFCKLSLDGELLFGKCACLHWILTPKQVAKMG